MYKAIVRFADLQDGMRIYEAGAIYPRPGLMVSDERIAELAGSDNRMGYPLIAPVQAAKQTPKDLPAQDAKPAKKPRKARQKG